MAGVSELRVLQKSLEDVKKSLADTETNIEKLTGRKLMEGRSVGRGRFGSAGDAPRPRNRSWTSVDQRLGEPISKRRDTGGSIGRFSGHLGKVEEDKESSDEENERKPSLSSMVEGGTVTKIGSLRSSRSKSDLEETPKNKERNKRMFGALLVGTLRQFKADQEKEVGLGKDKKRQEIESRVEQEKQAFRDEMIVKRKELFSQRRADRQKLRELQRQIEVTSMLSDWEKHYNLIGKYIKTQQVPPLFYLPKKHTKITEELLKKSQSDCQDHLKKLSEDLKNDPKSEDANTTREMDTQAESIPTRDLGELEGKPAELNIAEQQDEKEKVDSMDVNVSASNDSPSKPQDKDITESKVSGNVPQDREEGRKDTASKSNRKNEKGKGEKKDSPKRKRRSRSSSTSSSSSSGSSSSSSSGSSSSGSTDSSSTSD